MAKRKTWWAWCNVCNMETDLEITQHAEKGQVLKTKCPMCNTEYTIKNFPGFYKKQKQLDDF